MTIKLDRAIAVGTPLPAREFNVDRKMLVMYCGACGDFAPTHWNERIARSVGLPDVIAHGGVIMAKTLQAVTDWVGDPGAVVDCRAQFSRPLVVPDDDVGAMLRVTGVVEEKLDHQRVVIRLNAESGGQPVLSAALAVVRLS